MKQSKKTCIIAEAGVNHNGDVQIAYELIDAAKQAGADAVKFQTWKTEFLVTEEAEMSKYQFENTGIIESQFSMLKKLELTYSDFSRLKDHCELNKIEFLSTPDEIESAKFLNKIQKRFKIGSGELNNIPYLRQIGAFGKPVLLATGMGSLQEVFDAVEALEYGGLRRDNITLLHAVTSYPAPIEETNLLAMRKLGEIFALNFGLSDHTEGIFVPIAATALGATVIEKHFTLDKNMQGPDHKASLDPEELGRMIKAIRNIESAMGSGEKKISESEKANVDLVRKSVVASRDIRVGEPYSEENLTTKRPGTGLAPKELFLLIGQRANKNYKKDELIEKETD